MNPRELLDTVAPMLWNLVDDELTSVASAVSALQPLAGETEPALQDKLLEQLPDLPQGGALLDLLHDIVPVLPPELRVHGWRQGQGAPHGLALVVTHPSGRAVLAFTPGPTLDVVVTAGTDVTVSLTSTAEWDATLTVAAQTLWTATVPRGDPAPPANGGTASLDVLRKQRVTMGAAEGPGASAARIETRLRVGPGSPFTVEVALHAFTAAVLPPVLAGLLGAKKGASMGPTNAPLTVRADRSNGIRFADGGIRVDLPLQLELPGVSTRGVAIGIGMVEGRLALLPSLTVLAQPPGMPIALLLGGLGVSIPIDIGVDGIGVGPQLEAKMPSDIGVSLALPPVSGGGALLGDADGYRGVLDIDLGIVGVKALGVLTFEPLSFVVLLGLQLPYPGIQLGFGFALDGVGGIVGVNRRIDIDRLRGLVAEGNADRVLFPGNDVVARADEITRSLDSCFPVARGRFVIGPMVRINWGGRIVTLAVAVVLDLPGSARAVVLGRVVVAVPDPAAPLILLQAGVFGRIDPGVPMVDFLVSLNGSWIVGYPLTGQIYVLFRGGGDPVFVLSAGGFHPRYQRPAGVPQLQRLGMNLGGGFLRLRAESYLALTSNSLQFGAKLQLDATIAGCGVEGNLGLDALLVWDPVLFFSVHVHAGVAVLAFGRRLAGVGLDFTLEGPGEWHAFGTGSISVLFWDVSLDFDVRWGDKPALTPRADDILENLRQVIVRRESWTIERTAQRASIRYTDEAATALAEGTVAQPDSTLTLDQTVVPLQRKIARFHRVTIPEQEWTFTEVELEPNNRADLNRPTENLFVPGEFFAMTEEHQLTAPAFERHPSGYALTETDLDIGTPRLADDTYETDYEVDENWFPQNNRPKRIRLIGKARFALETWSRPVTTAERLDRWRAVQADTARPMVVNR
ncbi:DUF6603 domain-containing protein [Nocardia shimofusensis]|uniref:DUF6603 domain-containing protein n=1 Tax=Nocardia shimofusensis TaxID=228596 RepID=UPI00082D473B|nr:DUF6603 domain-containing protein [Nocardia shimofusensis]